MSYDLIILGGGAAGLSLANHLADSNSLRVLVLEKREAYSDDRTWCFWEEPRRVPEYCPVSHRWSRWSFSTDARETVHESDKFRYHCVQAGDFYKESLERLAATKSIEISLGVDATLDFKEDLARVQVDGNMLRARHIIDCRPPEPVRAARSTLVQSFVGVTVDSDRNRFTPDKVDLMANLKVESSGFKFSYVLPFSQRRALVELTKIAPPGTGPHVSMRELEDFLDVTIGAGRYSIESTEAGRLPMGLPSASGPLASNVWRAGTRGGALRMSSGYAFLRIQRWAQRCAERLLAGKPPVHHPEPPFVERSLDRLFLELLRDRPELASDIFMAMGEKLPADRFVRFMIDRPTLLDRAALLAALPKAPFMGQLVRTTARKKGAQPAGRPASHGHG